MTTSSSYRFVFWGLLLVFVLAFVWAGIFAAFGVLEDVHRPAALVPLFLLTSVYIGVIAGLVQRDARRRGLDPWLWSSVAAFVPYLVGVVIYLVVRSNASSTCGNCGRTRFPDSRFCPHCGSSQQSSPPTPRNSASENRGNDD